MFQDDNFVEVYSKTTGDKQVVPRAWLGQPIGADFELTPSGRESAREADGPSLDWTLKQLEAHADERGVDRTGLRSKAEVLAAIEDQAPDTEVPDDQPTPTDQADGQ